LNYDFLDSLTLPACIINAEGSLLFRNIVFSDIFGNTCENLSLDIEHQFYADYRKKIASSYSKALKGIPTRCFVVMSRDASKKMPVEIYLYPVKLPDQMQGILAIFYEVENSRLFSFNSKISFDENLYPAHIFEFSPFPIIQLSKEYQVVQASNSTEQFTGMALAKLYETENSFLPIFAPYDQERIKSAVSEIFAAISSFKRVNDIHVTNHAGEELFCNLLLYHARENGNIYAVEIIVEDITEKKKLENKLAKMNRIQIFSDITKGLLHSFNNIINVIINRTQMLMPVTEKSYVYDGLNSINESALDAATQIRRIQDFLKSENQDDSTTTSDIIALIKDAIEFARIHFKVEFKEKGREIAIIKHYYTKGMIRGNISTIREIFISMIFRISSLIRTRGKIEIELQHEQDLSFKVELKKEYIDAEPIESGGEYLPQIELRRIAERLNIRIIEEESSDAISIRAVLPSSMIESPEEEKKQDGGIKIRDLDIMIVEDEPALSQILFELFDLMGNRVAVFDSAEEALTEVKNHKYDIVISDYGLKKMTGLELLAKVRELHEATLTILLTGWILDDKTIYENSIDLFMQKPFQIQDLLIEAGKKIAAKKTPR